MTKAKTPANKGASAVSSRGQYPKKAAKAKLTPETIGAAAGELGAAIAAKGAAGGMSSSGDVPARARARGLFDPEVFEQWCRLIAHGKTQRFAAIGVGHPLTTIRGWMDTRPELHEQMKDAMEVEIQRRLDESDDLPLAIGSGSGPSDKVEDAAAGGIHPKAAELKIKQNNWRLSWLDAERFGDKRRVETTGKDGGPIQTEQKQLVTYEFPANPIIGKPGD